MFQDFCIRVPVLKLPTGGVAACSSRRAADNVSGGTTQIFRDDWDDEPAFWEVTENKTSDRVKREIDEQPSVFSSLYGESQIQKIQ